MNRGAL